MSRQNAKRIISSASKETKGCASDLNDLNHMLGKVIVDEKGVKDWWKEYMEKLKNEDNE